MTDLTLDDLDVAFDNLWQHQNQIPALLETWQSLLTEYLCSGAMKVNDPIDIKNRINYWEMAISNYGTGNTDYYISSTLQ
jgi:hypothetical protein